MLTNITKSKKKKKRTNAYLNGFNFIVLLLWTEYMINYIKNFYGLRIIL